MILKCMIGKLEIRIVVGFEVMKLEKVKVVKYLG
jgi:hypothetical protein